MNDAALNRLRKEIDELRQIVVALAFARAKQDEPLAWTLTTDEMHLLERMKAESQ